jgi:hypothetical protein
MTPQPANREAVAISLLGPLVIREGTQSLGDRHLCGARPQQVLEILLAACGHRVPTDRLADLPWGERIAQNAAAALQTFISVLHRRLSADRRRARESSWSPSPRRIGSPLSWPTSTSIASISCSSAQERPRRASARGLREQALALVRGEVLKDGATRAGLRTWRSTQLPPCVVERTVAEGVREVPIP